MNRADGDIVRDFLSVADFLEEPQLAHWYTCPVWKSETTIEKVLDVLNLPGGKAYAYVDRLVDIDVIEIA